MGEIYLDNSATTKPFTEVVAAVNDVLINKYGNPSSIYKLGEQSKQLINDARTTIARTIGAKPGEIYFTSGGTESNNLAITGTCLANENYGRKIVTTVAEHPSVTKTIRIFKRQGWDVAYIPAQNGELDLQKLADEIDESTVLVSVMLVNNETGAIFPVDKIKNIIKMKKSPALLHCDAVQAYGKLNFSADSLNVDLISISAHKINGVKGCGALYVREGTNIFATMFGGGQESGLRSGTESSPLIAGFGSAAKVTFENFNNNVKVLKRLKEYCLKKIQQHLPSAVINSTIDGAPHIVNFSLPNVLSSDLVAYLSDRKIYVGSGAACKSNHSRGPAMLESLGLSRNLANGAIRISFSYNNSELEIDRLITEIKLYLTENY